MAFIDDKARVARVEGPGLAPIDLGYEQRGFLVSMAYGPRTYGFAHNAAGNLVVATDPLGRTVAFEYDKADRPTKLTLPGGRVVELARDPNGNVMSLTPPGRLAHTFTYTPGDLLEGYTAPDVGEGPATTRFQYNKDRDLTSITQPDGTAIGFTYDAAGRLVGILYPEDERTIRYHPTTGQPAAITSASGELAFEFDGFLPTRTTWSGAVSGSYARTYDNNFWIVADQASGAGCDNNPACAAVTYAYDNDGLPKAAGPLAIERDPVSGRVAGTTLGAITDRYGYNEFGEVISLTVAHQGAVIISFSYTRDGAGRITKLVETLGNSTRSQDFSYDDAGRLASATWNGAQTISYTYDTTGNRTARNFGGGSEVARHDAQDRLLSFGNFSYTYSANGNLRSRTEQTATIRFDYDALGELRNATLPGGLLIEYVVDGLGRRIGRKVDGHFARGWLWGDYHQPIAEIDANGAIETRFVYAVRPTVPDVIIRKSGTYRIVSDQVGSVRFILDAATGAIVQAMDYDEFGNVLTSSNPAFQTFAFAGGLWDAATGHVRFGIREYDPRVGRWTGKDPLLFEAGDTNVYGYAFNDPLNFIDPDGLQAASAACPTTRSFGQCFSDCVSDGLGTAASAVLGAGGDAYDYVLGLSITGAVASVLSSKTFSNYRVPFGTIAGSWLGQRIGTYAATSLGSAAAAYTGAALGAKIGLVATKGAVAAAGFIGGYAIGTAGYCTYQCSRDTGYEYP